MVHHLASQLIVVVVSKYRNFCASQTRYGVLFRFDGMKLIIWVLRTCWVWILIGLLNVSAFNSSPAWNRIFWFVIVLWYNTYFRNHCGLFMIVGVIYNALWSLMHKCFVCGLTVVITLSFDINMRYVDVETILEIRVLFLFCLLKILQIFFPDSCFFKC